MYPGSFRRAQQPNYAPPAAYPTPELRPPEHLPQNTDSMSNKKKFVGYFITILIIIFVFGGIAYICCGGSTSTSKSKHSKDHEDKHESQSETSPRYQNSDQEDYQPESSSSSEDSQALKYSENPFDLNQFIENEEDSVIPKIGNNSEIIGLSGEEPTVFLTSIVDICTNMKKYLIYNETFEPGKIELLSGQVEKFYKDLHNSDDPIIMSRLLRSIKYLNLDIICLIMSAMQPRLSWEQLVFVVGKHATYIIHCGSRLFVYSKAKMNLLNLRESPIWNSKPEIKDLGITAINELLRTISFEFYDSTLLFGFLETLTMIHLDLSLSKYENFSSAILDIERQLSRPSKSIRYSALDVIINIRFIDVNFKCLVLASLRELTPDVQKLFKEFIGLKKFADLRAKALKKLELFEKSKEIPRITELVNDLKKLVAK
jgi:hypothetical protein